LEDAAQFYEIYRKADGLYRFINETFAPIESGEPRELHRKLWRLPNTRFIYTTNFDFLIEDAIERPKQSPRVVTEARDLRDIDESERIVFKPHGCARMSKKREAFVITRNDFLN